MNRLSKFWTPNPRVVRAAASDLTEADGLEAFGSEAPQGPEKDPAGQSPLASPVLPRASSPDLKPAHRRVGWIVAVALLVCVAAAGAAYAYRAALTRRSGSLTVNTVPSSAEVFIRGKSVGRTPLTLPLAAGSYDVQIGDPKSSRTINVQVLAGVSTVHYLELPPPVPEAPVSAGLKIDTEPSHLQVQVDGEPRGLSPLALAGLAPGDHQVTVRTPGGVVRRSVTLRANETFSLILSSPVPGPEGGAASAGWLTIGSAVTLQVWERGKLLGTNESERIMLPVGEHQVDLVSDALGFRTQRTLSIAPGRNTYAKVELPTGTLSLNAQPWADVWIDGERVGQTPIGNISRTIGSHEVVFRHPDLGERRQTVVVTLQQPVRVGIDLRKK